MFASSQLFHYRSPVEKTLKCLFLFGLCCLSPALVRDHLQLHLLGQGCVVCLESLTGLQIFLSLIIVTLWGRGKEEGK